MDHFQTKEQNYTKWDDNIWHSVEKEISQFQKKVTDAMLRIGELNKDKIEDFKVQPILEDDVILGQDFYLQIIRPICVNKGYLPKQIPTEADLLDDNPDDSSDEDDYKEKKRPTTTVLKKEEKKQKKGGKKGSKNQKSNDNEIKLKIIKENFLKQIDLVLNSHSFQRMQYQFGLKQKKIQLKLITFFYIAYYIRKNKQKQKIDESQIFELANILIKIVRIFSGYRGRSFFGGSEKKKNEVQSLEISPSLLLDMKMCIKGIKDFYKYTNKKIIINYPKLVYYTNYDRFFPTLDIKPYPSQIQFIQAVKKAFNLEKGTINNPTLILYRTMIGSGKTSASISLSNLINQTKYLDTKNENYQVLYSCLIGSVRVQVGRYAYNNKQKFALAAMQKSIKDQNYFYPRIINSYSCKNQKVVDLIISDLDCTYHMFDRHHLNEEEQDIMNHERKERKNAVNQGKLQKENIVLFIDEPTAFCKDVSSPTTQRLFNILGNYPPKVIILASATMPTKQQLKNTIKLVQQRNPGLQVFQVDSKQFQIGCQYCSFKGQIIFPHTNVKNKEELERIVKLVQTNPFLLRLYTGPSLYFLLKKCESVKIKDLPDIEKLPEVRQQDISKCTMRILNNLLKYEDKIIEEVCRLSVDQAKIDYKIVEKDSDSDDDIFGNDEQEKIQQAENSSKPDYVNFKKMLREDAHKFLGGCLIATQNPLEFAQKYFSKWLRIGKKEYIKPVRRLLQKYQKQVEALEKQIKLLQDDDRRDDIVTKQITKLQNQKQPKMDFPDYKRINTIDHYHRYCKQKEPVHLSMLIKPMTIQTVAADLIQQVDDFVLKLLFCGVALYMEKGLSSKYLDKVEQLASLNYLAYIITDQSLCYGTNFPISNVILLDDLANKLNMNEMFQLIGRAGRVGQSWTARAFLQQKGLLKLSQFIRSQDQKMSEQAEIFEAIAESYLDNPKLTLRTTKSEIKYANLQQPGDSIDITIKKAKQENYHIFKKITLVPFLDDSSVLVKKIEYQTVNYYEFPQSDILYEDLPTTTNSKGEAIIDVSAYYKNEQQFIRNTIDNAVKRILKTQLNGVITNTNQVNQFKPKVYQDFFNMKTNTFAVLIKCTEAFSVGNYSFSRLKSNAFEKLDENITSKIDKYVSTCRKLAKQIRRKPESFLQHEAKQIKQIHEEFIDRTKTAFYKQFVKTHWQEVKRVYEELTVRIEEKSSLQAAFQSIVVLLVDGYTDLQSVEDKLFHVDRSVRGIWGHLSKTIQK